MSSLFYCSEKTGAPSLSGGKVAAVRRSDDVDDILMSTLEDEWREMAEIVISEIKTGGLLRRPPK